MARWFENEDGSLARETSVVERESIPGDPPGTVLALDAQWVCATRGCYETSTHELLHWDRGTRAEVESEQRPPDQRWHLCDPHYEEHGVEDPVSLGWATM